MKRLYLTVEGQTEAALATQVLAPHLATFQVHLHRPRFTGLNSRRAGRIPRGGLLHTFKHALADMRRWLLEDQSPDARFSMMVDLYGLPTDFPGFGPLVPGQSGAERAVALERALANVIADFRFIPYLQVHEFEALVLHDPRLLKNLYGETAIDLEAFYRECRRYPSPEEINLGPTSHPKYRIKRYVPDYDENVAGPSLVEEHGLQALRVSCPHFGAWLTRLEMLDTPGPDP